MGSLLENLNVSKASSVHSNILEVSIILCTSKEVLGILKSSWGFLIFFSSQLTWGNSGFYPWLVIVLYIKNNNIYYITAYSFLSSYLYNIINIISKVVITIYIWYNIKNKY